MIKDRVLLIGLFSLILGVGIYFTKDSFRSSPDRQNLSGKSAQDSSLIGSNANTSVVSAASCSFETSGTPHRNSVILNEIAWMGNAESANNEWIELKNISRDTADIGGWHLMNRGGKINVVVKSGAKIPAGGFYLLERSNQDFLSGMKADQFYTGAIKNSDEELRLFDKNCVVADEAIANVGAGKNWPAGTASPQYRTAERSSNLSWHTYGGSTTLTTSGSGTNGVFGTPRAENSLPAVSAVEPPPHLPSPASPQSSQNITLPPSPTLSAPQALPSAEQSSSASTPPPASPLPAENPPPAPTPPPSPARSNVNHILISQVQTTGGAGHTENDFVEIYNPTDSQFNLKGYRLVKRTQTGMSDTLIKSWTADAFIPAYGFYLWANSGFTSIAKTPDSTTTASVADNSGIAIRFGPNDTGTIIDSVAWGKVSTTNAFVESSAFLTNPAANQSILRRGWPASPELQRGEQDACVAASFDASIGNGCDMQNNASDFETSPNSNPRNSTVR